MRPEEIPIVVISLDRRPDRWAQFLERAAAADIDQDRVVRLSAVDASTLDMIHHPSVSILTAHNIKKGVRRAHYEIDRPGAVGASLSHFNAWKHLETSRSEAVIVFEDDTYIPTDFNDRLATLVNDLPLAGDWDVVTFYNTPFTGGVHGCPPSSSAKGPWSSCASLMGAFAYMVSRRGVRRLLERAYPIELHVDAYMAFMARLDYIQMVWHPVMQILPNFDDSDINHGGSDILNIPTDLSKSGLVLLDNQAILGIVAIVAIAGSILSLALLRTK